MKFEQQTHSRTDKKIRRGKQKRYSTKQVDILKRNTLVAEVAKRNWGLKVKQKMTENSKYNKKYKELASIGVPLYLKKVRDKKDQKILTRFRTGNEEKVNKFWIKEEDKACRLC